MGDENQPSTMEASAAFFKALDLFDQLYGESSNSVNDSSYSDNEQHFMNEEDTIAHRGMCSFCIAVDRSNAYLLDSRLNLVDRLQVQDVSCLAISQDFTAYFAVSNEIHMIQFCDFGFLNGCSSTKAVAPCPSFIIRELSVSPSGFVYVLSNDCDLIMSIAGNIVQSLNHVSIVTKWSPKFTSRIHDLQFDPEDKPTAISCFRDTEDVLVGYNSGSFSIYNKYGVHLIKKDLCENPVTRINGVLNRIYVASNNGSNFFQMDRKINALVGLYSLHNSKFPSFVVGGGIFFDPLRPRNYRFVGISLTSDGNLCIDYPSDEVKFSLLVPGLRKVSNSLQLNKICCCLAVSREGRLMYAGCKGPEVVLMSQDMNNPVFENTFTPVDGTGGLRAIACVTVTRKANRRHSI